ncbi:glycosyltransferase [Pseudooceanicola aestuarii]|uniref:glycosyltransferase n=1 Tax=Pseudooceanicola aestuarii TaxID=2697319 RepID=UPI0013CFA230|nr:glycosyltransferase [Pseudooceanicola aestuarii]
MSRVQLLGLCRFSYPTALDGFSVLGTDAARNRARLYDPARLALRFWFFERICLPSLAAQQDPEFTVLLLHDAALPEPWLTRLRDAIAPLPQVVAVPRPAGLPHKGTCRDILRAARDPQARAVAEFTIDDDDALAVDFTARTRAAFGVLRPLWRDVGRTAVDFNSGLVLRATGGLAERRAEGAPTATPPAMPPQPRLGVEPVQAHLWAPGTAIYHRPRSTRSIQDFNHRRLWSRIPTLSLPEPVMYLRGAHGTNDSNVARARPTGEAGQDVASEQGAQVLRDRFGLDLDALLRDWVRVGTP